MKSIVVYKIIFLLVFLVLAQGLYAQKPAIDLISSHHQNRHPEANIDTGYAVTPPIKDGFFTPSPAVQKPYLREETKKKKRRQIGPSLDSLFQKEDPEAIKSKKSPLQPSFFNHKYNPINFLINITALK